MADLGSIGTYTDLKTIAGVSWFTGTGPCDKHGVQTPRGRITGVAKIAGVVAPGHMVHLVERSTRRLLRSTAAGAGGVFIFDGLNTVSEDYLVVMMDEGDTGSYNAKTADRVTAIAV
jgi:hypothetical protein